jgi:two-component system cell cycle sensor histidine kinase/response regulator CckA
VIGDQTYSKYVLIVDDEPEVVAITASILDAGGYKVLKAHGGMEALGLIRAAEGPIGLLITDVVMPDLNGPHLADELRQQIPDLRVIFMSGWEPHVIAHEGPYHRGYPMLAKPFTAAALLQLVDEVLGASSSAPHSAPTEGGATVSLRRAQ